MTLQLVRASGLEIRRDELETIREPEGDATFLWILARKPAQEGSSRPRRTLNP